MGYGRPMTDIQVGEARRLGAKKTVYYESPSGKIERGYIRRGQAREGQAVFYSYDRKYDFAVPYSQLRGVPPDPNYKSYSVVTPEGKPATYSFVDSKGKELDLRKIIPTKPTSYSYYDPIQRKTIQSYIPSQTKPVGSVSYDNKQPNVYQDIYGKVVKGVESATGYLIEPVSEKRQTQVAYDPTGMSYTITETVRPFTLIGEPEEKVTKIKVLPEIIEKSESGEEKQVRAYKEEIIEKPEESFFEGIFNPALNFIGEKQEEAKKHGIIGEFGAGTLSVFSTGLYLGKGFTTRPLETAVAFTPMTAKYIIDIPSRIGKGEGMEMLGEMAGFTVFTSPKTYKYLPKIKYTKEIITTKTGKSVTIYKGFYGEFLGKSKGIIGKTAEGYKIGDPSFKYTYSYGDIIGDITPKTSFSGKIYTEALKLTTSEKQRIQLGTMLMKELQFKDVGVVKNILRESKTWTPEQLNIILEFGRKKKGEFFGSFPTQSFLPEFSKIKIGKETFKLPRRKAGDIDIQFKVKGLYGEVYAKQLVTKLNKVSGGTKARVSLESPTLVEAYIKGKGWVHGIDIKTLDLKGYEIAPEQAYGFSLKQKTLGVKDSLKLFQKKYKFQRPSEQFLRKGASSLTLSERGVWPKSHRVKDIYDMFAISSYLIEKSGYKGVKTKIILEKFAKTYSKQDINEIMKAGEGYVEFSLSSVSSSRLPSLIIKPSFYNLQIQKVSKDYYVAKPINASRSLSMTSKGKISKSPSISPRRSLSPYLSPMSKSKSPSRYKSPSLSKYPSILSPNTSISPSLSRSIKKSPSLKPPYYNYKYTKSKIPRTPFLSPISISKSKSKTSYPSISIKKDIIKGKKQYDIIPLADLLSLTNLEASIMGKGYHRYPTAKVKEEFRINILEGGGQFFAPAKPKKLLRTKRFF